MKLKSYKDFVDNSINEEEGWKDKALAATLAAGTLMGSGKASNIDSFKDYDKNKIEVISKDKEKDKTETRYKETTSKEVAERLQNQKWTLDSVVVDTIWKELDNVSPPVDTIISEIRFDDRQYFESGKYDLNEMIIDSLDNAIEEILEDNGVIMGIMVESSTDKQGLSVRLQKELQSKGYEGNNKGLSKARSESITNYLESIGVDTSIIETNQIYEAGEGEIDQSARYVTVKFLYIKEESIEAPAVIENLPEIKEKYYLSKEFAVSKKKKIKNKKKKVRVVKSTKTKTKKTKGLSVEDCGKFFGKR